ncbi:MAG: bifunctional diaminohydroxyphosphoribosylaminopyrimidine deaminase/5-amino-6-(5-phosphoribosylamino)uracil reductase RibD, partial [Gammaproteobacteria bacterium]|nr:bifunctional diaminohydroxyphosphoribosylaminopyrimidine deaminase/5-amino-6-(5-phosphoribosylamino)uracil reductase RibD [Gammaproteobacteria bacterium]
GCVLARGERLIGEGWHEHAGEAHAEVAALRAAGGQAAGATAYVTLEPCSHQGRTPPCTQALIAARVGRVVFALDDPNPLVNGRGAAALRAAGITVESGLLAAEAAELNPGFLMRMRAGRPFVRLKLAMSLDGRTALADGASRWISGPAARADVQAWRARSSALLTGVGTILADDPQLTVRSAEGEAAARQPLRVVLDGQLRTPMRARLLSTPGEVLLLSALGAFGEAHAAELSARGARIELLPAHGTRLELGAVLDRLAELEVNELLVEAGPTLAGALLEAQRVDELLLYVAPKLLGPTARPLVEVAPPATIEAARGFTLLDSIPLGADLRLRLRPAV